MMGHRVTLLESRDAVSRLNVLKLWEETVIDLDSLGLKHVDSAWSNKKEARASTARLQLALLKTALLLGVEVQVECSWVGGEVGRRNWGCWPGWAWRRSGRPGRRRSAWPSRSSGCRRSTRSRRCTTWSRR